MADQTLSELEAVLMPNQFFRANRQYIVNIDYVKGYKAYERVRVQLDIALPDAQYCVIVSQETAPLFRKWMTEA